MPAWYLAFIAAIALVCLTATERDRAAAWIILGNVAVGSALYALFAKIGAGEWRLAHYATVDTLTIGALLWLARRPVAYWQAATFAGMFAANLLCWWDVSHGTALIYDTYETVIALLCLAQVAGFHDTLQHLLRLGVARLGDAGRVGRGALRRGCCADSLLPRAGAARAQPLPQPCQTTPRNA